MTTTISLPIPASRRTSSKFRRITCLPVRRPWDMPLEELAEFDYLIEGKPNTPETWMDSNATFFKYRGETYDIGEFVRVVHPGSKDFNPFCHYDHNDTFASWDGIQTDSYFSAIVVKYLGDNADTIRVAQVSW